MKSSQRLLGGLVLAGSLLIATLAQAALPTVDRLEPLGVVRGEETTVVFHGNRVKDAHQVLTDVPGIEILSVKPLDNKKVEVTLKAQADLAPGLYPVRLVTRSGIANLRLIGVGTLPIVQEEEPNNDFESPQSIEFDTTVEGVVEREDVDHYQVELKAGQKLTAEIEGIRLAFTQRNRNVLDPYIAILDEGRFEVAASDDSSLLQQDGVCTYTAEEDGKYTILVRHSSFGGSNDSGYRLHVGDFPRPLAVIPAGGVTGSTLRATLVDIDGSSSEASVQLPSQPHPRWPVVTETDAGISPSPNWIRVNDLPVHVETEPNDDRRKAPEYAGPGAFCGVIEKEGDFDCFRFPCKKGEKFRVQVYARDVLRSPLDGVINVFGPDHSTLESADDSRGETDPYLEFRAAADGLHTVRIYDHLRTGSPVHTYRIEVRRSEPGFDLNLKELRRDEAMVVHVPVGGSGAMVVRADRQGYGGEINMQLNGLPEGVTATTYPVPEGRTEIPVLLTATADASPTATLFDITGNGDEKNSDVTGEFRQTHNLVLGQNRRDMWTYETDRAAVAVTQQAPFSIELVQPTTPIVRRGSKNLTVRIKRDEGYEGKVSLRTLYNPPGVRINNSRSIDKGKNEAAIPITANGGAATGKWPLIIIANYGSDNGPAQVASNPILLDVQDSLFDFSFPRSAAELESESTVQVSMEIKREYQGDATVELLGLPRGVSSPQAVQQVEPDSTSVSFPIVVSKDAKVGKNKTLVCRGRVKVEGVDEEIVQTVGTGELRVDKPLKPKKDKKDEAKEKKPESKKEEKKSAKEKPLSRLEQLRQMKKSQ